MPHSSRKKVLKIPFKHFEADKDETQKYNSILLKDKSVDSSGSNIPSFDDLSRPKQPSNLPRKALSSNSGKSKMDVFLEKSPLRSRNVIVDKLPTRNTSFLNKKIGSSHMVTETLMQKEQAAPRFMSILMCKGKLIRHRVTTQLLGRKFQWSSEVKRLPHAKRLQMFQALLNEPLPFLDLHARFGVSKRTIRGLVDKGILTEIWGPKAIGVRFKLTNKGEVYLKQLEAAAKYETKMREKNLIRLKHKT